MRLLDFYVKVSYRIVKRQKEKYIVLKNIEKEVTKIIKKKKK